MKYQIKCAETEQKTMFYSDCEPALRNACVGHLRMDFGNGNEFYSSWWGNRDDLNNSTFKAELNDVVNELRRNGLLKNRLIKAADFPLKQITIFFSFDVCPNAVTTTVTATATTSVNWLLRSRRSKEKFTCRSCRYEQSKARNRLCRGT